MLCWRLSRVACRDSSGPGLYERKRAGGYFLLGPYKPSP